MSSIVNQRIVLVLNSGYQAVGFKTVRHAIRSMCGGLRGQREPAKALVVDLGVDGRWRWTGERADWTQWLQLPARPEDECIHTGRGCLRAPLIIVSSHYDKMPMVKPSRSKRSILERDGYRCQYSGQVLPREQLTVDHVIPKHRGGTNDPSNLVACERGINQRKGHRLNSEANLTLIRPPAPLKAVPICLLIREPRHPAQAEFIKPRGVAA